MNGIDWRTIGNPAFERIVDTLLSIEFGARGLPVEGRGGEGEIPGDYSLDDGKIIFEYKYFPEGFPPAGPARNRSPGRSRRPANANPTSGSWSSRPN
jgi:hypothetical protein